jgi:hypothetical protein
MDDAAAECSLAVPSTFATNTTDSYAQLKRYMIATAKELLHRVDWANCTLDGTVTGDGTATYDLADDFGRLTRSDRDDEPAVWSDGMRRAFKPVTSNGEWTVLQSYGPTPSYGYRVVGSQIEFTQNIAVGDTVTYSYVSTGWISNASSRVATWASDADLTYLPGKLIELGTVWRWMRKRGLEFQSYQGEFEIELNRRSNDDRSIRKIGFGPKSYQKSPYANLPVPTLGPDPNI